MAERHSQESFVWRGNHPLLDFLNTEVIREGRRADLLTSPKALRAWMAHAGIPVAWPRDEAGIFGEAIVFRAHLRDLAEALAAGREVPAASLRAINEALGQQRGRFQVKAGPTGCGQVFVPDLKPGPLLGLALAASDLLCHHDPGLVRQCQSGACILFFLDTSKNHKRRWCSMQACGNRAKAAAHYQRQKSPDSPG
jgi:predicted RNA-binding Zn ribbon-like protein